MSTTQHPLTETDAAGLWDGYLSDDHGVWHRQDYTRKARAMDALRAAFDAGREHERTNPAAPTLPNEDGAVIAPAEPLARTLLAVPEGYGAPHHDAGRIKPGDYVAQLDKSGFIRAGIAHHYHDQDGVGDWHTEDHVSITWTSWRADRPDAVTVWPAPTPPAVEVEMPGEFGAVILNPRWGVRSYTRAVHLGEGVWAAEVTPGADVYTHLARDLRSATRPDGTRVRRDGNHANGEPRFVKVKEGEK